MWMDVVRDGVRGILIRIPTRQYYNLFSTAPTTTLKPPPPKKKIYCLGSGDLFSGFQGPNRESDHSSLMLNLRITGYMLSLLHIPSWRIQKQIYLHVYLLSCCSGGLHTNCCFWGGQSYG